MCIRDSARFVGLPDQPHVAGQPHPHLVGGAARAGTCVLAKLHVRVHAGAIQVGLEVGVEPACH
eukprot:294537-Prymnesium_polylepis.1